jgi:GMP synthase-like glutamine amidotransferase
VRRAAVDFVITEHPAVMTRPLERHYEGIRRQLEQLAGVTVRSRLYLDADDFADAAAVVLSGSFAPWALHDSAALARLGASVGRFEGPVLGICAGMQLQMMFAGGAIAQRERPAVGYGAIDVLDEDGLLLGLGVAASVYEHHSFNVLAAPEGFAVLARSGDCAVEAVAAPERRWWGTQFHPERFDDQHPAGARVLRNFFALAGLGTSCPDS